MVMGGKNNTGLDIGFWENDHPSGSAKVEATQGEKACLEGLAESQPEVPERKW